MTDVKFKYKGDKEQDTKVGFTYKEYYISERNSEHYMRKFQGYGLSSEIINQLKLNGVSKVIIIYNGKTGVKYLLSNLSQWENSLKIHQNKEDDLQKFVSERDMKSYVSVEEIIR